MYCIRFPPKTLTLLFLCHLSMAHRFTALFCLIPVGEILSSCKPTLMVCSSKFLHLSSRDNLSKLRVHLQMIEWIFLAFTVFFIVTNMGLSKFPSIYTKAMDFVLDQLSKLYEKSLRNLLAIKDDRNV